MSNIVGCSMCNDFVDVTGRVIPLPFVCAACNELKEFMSATKDVTVGEATGATQPELSDETATAENTVGLVKDLIQQLEEAKQSISLLQQERRFFADQNQKLGFEKFRLNQLVANLLGELFDVCQKEDEAHQWEMHSHSGLMKAMQMIDNLKGVIRNHEDKTHLLKLDLYQAKESQDRQKQWLSGLSAELRELQSRWYVRLYKYLTEYHGVWRVEF